MSWEQRGREARATADEIEQYMKSNKLTYTYDEHGKPTGVIKL